MSRFETNSIWQALVFRCMLRLNMKKKSKRSSQRPQTRTSSSRNSLSIYTNIGQLYTLGPAAEKEGRRPSGDDLGEIRKAAIVIEGGRILWVGSEARLPKEWRQMKKARHEDLGGAVVCPALVECHTHLVFAGNRAAEFERRNQGESYQSIAASGGGINATVKPTRSITAAELLKLAQTRVDRFIRQGVTTIESKSGYGLNLAAESKLLEVSQKLKGARIVPTFLGAHAIPPEFRELGAAAYLEHLIEKVLPQINRRKLSRRVDIFVERGYFTEEIARPYLQHAKAMGFDLVVHADQLTRSGGARLAVELGAKSADHLLQIDSEDIQQLAQSDVTCVLLPNADLYMKCPYPPARDLIDNGARVALATDFNPGSSPTQDTALAGVLARTQMKMSLPETLVAYTVGAAHALGLQSHLGALTMGRFADFLVLDGPLEEMFLEIGRQPVRAVYREGRQLL